MNEVTEHMIALIKHMDEMECGEMELSLDFQNGKKRTIKIILDGGE